jgi:hypothetical protein
MRVSSIGCQPTVRFGSVPLSREIVEGRWKSLLGKFNEQDKEYLESHGVVLNKRIWIIAPDAELPVWRQKIADACQGDIEYKAVDGKQYYGGVEIRFQPEVIYRTAKD